MNNLQRASKVRASLVSPDDIAANKRGEITDFQRERLSGGYQWLKIVTTWDGVTIILLILLAFISPRAYQILPVWGWAIFLLCGLGYWIWVYLRAKRVERELKGGRIEQIDGSITKNFKIKTSSGEIRSFDSIRGGGLAPGKYQFFILPGIRLLVSAEKIDDLDIKNSTDSKLE
jgi:hypothetical protein